MLKNIKTIFGKEISEIEKNIGYSFKNKSLLKEALTHTSMRFDNKNVKTYERLEFLGDKILGFTIAEALFHKFPNDSEGDISRRQAHFVSGSVFAEVAKKLDIVKHVTTAKSHRLDLVTHSVRIGEDVFEAIVGAIFLDSNFERTREFILGIFEIYIDNASQIPPKDPKSALQEQFHKHRLKSPEYSTIAKEDGGFQAMVIFKDKEFHGTAGSKRAAEKRAAEKALSYIKSQK